MAAPAKKPAPAKPAKPKAKGGGKSGGPSFLLQHGERVGLVGAGVLCVLLLGTSLFMPGSGFTSGSPEEKADELKKKSDSVAQRLNDPRNLPSESDKPPKDSDKKRIQLDTQVVMAERYALDRLTDTATSGTLGRRVPVIFPVAEAKADIARVQLKTYILTKKGDKDALVHIKGGTGGGAAKTPPGFAGGRFGGPSAFPSKGMGRRVTTLSGLGMPGMAPQADDAKSDKTVVSVALDRLDRDAAGMTPAIQIRPRRLAVIAASFPFKKQVEEFRTRLGLRSVNDVLNEPSMEKDPKTKKFVGGGAFRFLSVVVERRELDGNSKPLGKGEWTELNLAEDYRELLKHAGRELEEETGDIAKLCFTGLVMPKIKQFRPEEHGLSASGAGAMPVDMGGPTGRPGGVRPPPITVGEGGEPMTSTPKTTPSQYPPIETSLTTIASTLKTMEGRKPEEVAQPNRFTGDDFNPFGPVGGPPKKEGDMVPGMPPGAIPGRPDAPMMNLEADLPEYCLVRAIDVNVEPGKAYEYRLKIRMANPNADRRDVANPMYAEARELESPWSVTPLKVAVTPELMYYAVDQKEVDRKKLNNEDLKDPDRRIYLQGHRWLTNVPLSTGGELIIGDWAVAERFPVYRGEYVGREERIEMPAWRYTAEAYVMADDGSRRRGKPSIPVPFSFRARGGQPETILVDFEKGDRGYKRKISRGEDKFDVKDVPDKAAPSVLLLNPDGRLVLREGAYDVSDTERAQRVKDFRKRIEEVTTKGKKEGGFDKR